MKKHHHIVQDDRAIGGGKGREPPRVAPRLEGAVRNAGIKNKRKESKPKPKAK